MGLGKRGVKENSMCVTSGFIARLALYSWQLSPQTLEIQRKGYGGAGRKCRIELGSWLTLENRGKGYHFFPSYKREL